MSSGTNDIKIYTGELVVWGPETEDVAEESKIYLFDGDDGRRDRRIRENSSGDTGVTKDSGEHPGRAFTDLKTGEEQRVTELKKLDHSQYQENTMLSGDEDIALIDIPRVYKTVDAAEKEIAEKIKQSDGRLIAVNEDQNMRILIKSNNSLDEAASEKAVKETLSDGTSAEIHAAALANIEQLLSKARLGASHRDWHTYAKNQQRGTNKETALQIHRFYTAMQYGDDIYGVKMTVREKQNGSTVFYTLEAHDLDIEKITPETESSRGGVVKAALPGRSPAIQFSAFFEKFKPVDDLLGLKYKNKYPDIRFSVAPEDENLVVMHNVTAAKLRKAAKLGGLPVPSLAIVDAERSDFDNFGEISLIADKSLIDPKIKSNKVYNADIYSPRMPEVKNFYSQEDYAKVLRILKQYDCTAEERQASGLKTVEEIIYRHRGGMVSSDLLDNLLRDTYAVINWYCQEHGMETSKEWRKQSDLLNSSDFRNWWETVGIF